MIRSPFATRTTRFGLSAGRDMANKKPRRTAVGKTEARAAAKKVKGAFVSLVPRFSAISDDFRPNAIQLKHFNDWQNLPR